MLPKRSKTVKQNDFILTMKEKWLWKTIFHPEMKMCAPWDHSRCRWVCFFIWEIQHYITCSVTDALQWMGAVRMRVQTADNIIRLIHTTPSVNILSCEVKSCVFVRNHWDILTSNHHCLPKYKSIIHNNAYSRDKVTSKPTDIFA